jgi:hypothetical protein
MSLSAERIAIADRAILQTFKRSSVAWQAVPYWDTGDRGQSRVRGDTVFAFTRGFSRRGRLPAGPLGTGFLRIRSLEVPFLLTLGQATATTPDALLAAVIPRTAELARRFDRQVLRAMRRQAVRNRGSRWYRRLRIAAPDTLNRLIRGRRVLENAGFRSSSALIASTAHFIELNQLTLQARPGQGPLLGASVNSLYRASQLDDVRVPRRRGRARRDLALMLGRRQEMVEGAAATASAGEEPVDIAVSVPPSLEVVGERANGLIEAVVRIRFATRVKDARGVVVFHT